MGSLDNARKLGTYLACKDYTDTQVCAWFQWKPAVSQYIHSKFILHMSTTLKCNCKKSLKPAYVVLRTHYIRIQAKLSFYISEKQGLREMITRNLEQIRPHNKT